MQTIASRKPMTLSTQGARGSMLVHLIRACSLPETCNRWVPKPMVKIPASDTGSRSSTKWHSSFPPHFFWKYFSPFLFSKILTHLFLLSRNTQHHLRVGPQANLETFWSIENPLSLRVGSVFWSEFSCYRLVVMARDCLLYPSSAVFS